MRCDMSVGFCRNCEGYYECDREPEREPLLDATRCPRCDELLGRVGEKPYRIKI